MQTEKRKFTSQELAALPPGRHRIDERLYLLVRANKLAGKRASWTTRYINPATGRLAEITLGKHPEVGLRQARLFCQDIDGWLDKGRDPRGEWKPGRTVLEGRRITLRRYADTVIERKSSQWRNRKSARQWLSSLEKLGDDIMDSYLCDIQKGQLRDRLIEIDKETPETAQRILSRVNMIYRAARNVDEVTENDPVSDLFASKREFLGKKIVKNHRALPHKALPQFMLDLRESDGRPLVRLALEFLVLSACRSAFVRELLWAQHQIIAGFPCFSAGDKSNHQGRVSEEHILLLTPRMTQILERMESMFGPDVSPWVFYSPYTRRKDKVLSENTFAALIERMGYRDRVVPHGFRSTFSTWANENNENRDAIEVQLGHTSNDIRSIYNRSEYLQQRYDMALRWEQFALSLVNA